MKATDLMIGDWVQFSYRHPETDERVVRVFQITQIEAQLGDYYVWSEKNGRVCHPEWLQPIPLTPEILEKNGFQDISYKRKKLETEHDFFALQKGEDGENLWWWELFFSPILPINTVHELQHALRLCGIEKEIEL